MEVPSSVSQQYRIIDNYLPTITTDNPTTGGGEVESHRKFTKSGDDIIIIGGGIVITTVNAAKECAPGSVTIYEGSERHVRIIRDVAQLNNVASQCRVRHAVVGPSINIRDKTTSSDAKEVRPGGLPECDVIEMD